MSFQTEYRYKGLGRALEAPVVFLAIHRETVSWVPGIMTFNRVRKLRVRQLTLSDKLVFVVEGVVSFARRHGGVIGVVVFAAANLYHIVTVAFGINGLSTCKVGMTLAAIIIRRTGVHKVVSTPELGYARLELQRGIGTLIEGVPTRHVVAKVVLVSLFRNALTLARGRSSDGKASQGGQDGK